MTTASLVTANRTVTTAVRPRRSLDELVDRLMATLFSEGTETSAPTATPSLVRSVHGGATAQAGWTDRRRAGGSRRCGHGECGDEPGSVGLLRVEAAGETAVWRQGRAGVQPGNRKGSRAGSHKRRRDARGRRGARDALEAGQGRLRVQLAGDWTPGTGLPRSCFGGGSATSIAHAYIATPVLQARCPLLPLNAPHLSLGRPRLNRRLAALLACGT